MISEMKNKSGCSDKTAYEAIKNIHREERRRLIEELKFVAEKMALLLQIKLC